jgi:uncharacterized protein (TIGR03435 family)
MNAVGSALSAAVIHMIWEGAIIGWALWVLLLLLRRRSPEIRYLLSCAALVCMTGAFLSTFSGVYSLHRATVIAAGAAYQLPVAEVAGIPQTMLPIWLAPEASSLQWLTWMQSWTLPVWCAGVVLCSLRLIAGCSKAHSLARFGKDPEDIIRTMVAAVRERIGLKRDVRLVLCESEEGVAMFGWLKPVVLLPPSALIGLRPDELEAVIAHELAHILRHDYAINVLQSVVETILFFHPMTWWISKQIRTERELCCDRVAVRVCGRPRNYAQALLKLARMHAAPRRLGLAATGGPLLHRVELLFGMPAKHLKPPHWSSAVTLLIGLLSISLNFNWSRLLGQTAGEPPRFEVVSVKVNRAEDGNVYINRQGTRYVASGVTLRLLLRLAYDVQSDQINGGPKWTDTGHFDIVATEKEGTPHPPAVIGGPPTPEQLMIRSLLGDRFGLRVHRETRQRPVYVLVPARKDRKPGPALKLVDVDCAAQYAPRDRATAQSEARDPNRCGTKVGPGLVIAQAQTMGQLAATLATLSNTGMSLDRPIVDGTGLAGVFDATLRFTPDRIPAGPAAPATSIDPDSPSIFTALQEQLGLKLEPRTGPVDVLVIDRAELPSEN